MVDDGAESSEETESLNETGGDPPLFDNYRSLIDPGLLIFVKKDDVPPFRFKAGGWELVRSSIKLGPAMMARIAAQGFFLCRLNEDQSSWTELADACPRPPIRK